MAREKTTVSKTFTDGTIESTVDFTGTFTPYWDGRMYYRDGSGSPPEPEEFDIDTSKLIDGDPMTIIYEVEQYYEAEKERMINRFFEILGDLIDKIDDDEKRRIRIKLIGHIHTFTEDLSYKLAEQLQKEYDDGQDDFD